LLLTEVFRSCEMLSCFDGQSKAWNPSSSPEPSCITSETTETQE